MKNRIKKNRDRKGLILLLPFYFLLFTCLNFAQTLAPGAPGKDAQWASAGKQGVGTSATLESKVWFTLQGGALTEVYYPNVAVGNVHLLQFVVVNPKTKKVETERDDATHEIKVNPINRTKNVSPISNIEIYRNFQSPSSLAFTQISRSKSKPQNKKSGLSVGGLIIGGDDVAWTISKSYVTNPENNSVVFSVEFKSSDPDSELYVYYDPSLANSGMGDTSWTAGNILLSKDKDYFSALTCRYCKFTQTTNGFLGINDGLTQLKRDGKITNTFDRAENGNVVQVAKIIPVFSSGKKNDFKFEMALGFGKDEKEAINSINKSLLTEFDKVKENYQKEWIDYIKTLPKVDPKYQAQFNMAAMILKAHEDKIHRGANIASLSVPWGGGDNANEDNVGGYHLVWSRDLYQVFTAYMALGDRDAAERALDFLLKVQQKPDGSFPQNSWLDGKPFWGSLQMDEVAYPLIMAYQLKRFDKETYQKHLKPAADFIVKNGPSTPQERWEEEGGYSPSTIAAEIAGLVCVAEIAKKNGDTESATKYLKTADEWEANIEKWTATTTGKYGDGNYYLRITQNGKPDAGEKIELNNGAGVFDEREIVDAGFLELVRLGIRSPDDPLIQKSVKVIDEVIKVKTPNGEAFYRYNHDGYGEMDDGRRWNWDGKYTGKGRLWVLLSGERGQYELALANRLNPDAISVKINGSYFLAYPKYTMRLHYNFSLNSAMFRLDAMQKFANNGLMIPEQVWDKKEVPEADSQFSPNLQFGEGTGSATPLAWSMAQFIRLAVNLQEGKNLDTPDVVYERYVLGKKAEAKSIPFIYTIKPAIRSEEKAEENGFVRDEIATNISGGNPQNLPKNPNIDFSKLKLVELCSSQWQRYITEKEKDFFKNLKKNPTFWKCDNGNVLAILTYKGKGKDIKVVGDFNNWKPTEEDIIEAIDSDNSSISVYGKVKFISFEFKPTSRVEYKLIVDGEWITDLLNPNKIDNGVGGENSVLEMPDYKPSEWAKDIEKSPLFDMKTSELEVDSKKFGKRTVKVYVPTEYYKRGIAPQLPVLYLQDGSDYITRGKAINVLERLVTAKKVEPFMLVFIDPKDRNQEYWANDDWAEFVAKEVVPTVENKYFSTIKTGRENRALLGASLGGITSIWTALKYPEIFANVGGQSSSFWVDDERVVKELAKLKGDEKFNFYIDDGTFEGVEDSRKVVKMLKEKGLEVTYVEGETGHNWTSWKDRLADAFIALWK